MASQKSIVFLYSELAQYFLSCLSQCRKDYTGEIHVIHWPINPEAPFKFNFPEGVSFYEKKEIPDLIGFVKNANPELIMSTGWMDSDYAKVCKQMKNVCPRVVSLDNQWRGDLKQKLATFLSPFILKTKFSHAWVPGPSQEKFAKKLGFAKPITSYYSADVDYFERIYQKFKSSKSEKFPKRFIYVGRYMEHKGIYEMWDAFISANEETGSQWEMWCLGVGDEYDKRTKHEKIKHFGFVQPSELESYIKDTGVFVLPSRFEPWGVVVHEYAVSGLPLLLSDKIGAASAFLEEGKNGFSFESNNSNSIKNAFLSIMNMQDQDLISMSNHSNQMGHKISPKTWTNQLLSILN